MWLFNSLVVGSSSRKLCSRKWGMRIRARLAMVETWAEKQVGILVCHARVNTSELQKGLQASYAKQGDDHK